MNPALLSRRRALTRMGHGLGGLAFAHLLNAETAPSSRMLPLPGLPHFAPRAKRVIFLFMSGGPSHIDCFDYKPKLNQWEGKPLPDSYRNGAQKLPGMSGSQTLFQLKGSSYKFSQHGQSGAWVSDAFPHIAKVVDDLCFLKAMHTESVNHDPAFTFMQTGSPIAGRPSVGAWLQYGLGRETDDLPGFIVLISRRPVDQPLSAKLWGSGFLPTKYEGVQFRASKDPVLYLSDPPGITRQTTRSVIDGLRELHDARPSTGGGAVSAPGALDARLAEYEMAFRMQTSIPEATDITTEPEHVVSMYGPDARTPGSFAANCILARRLAERGVKFIQLFHPGWDQHSGMEQEFPTSAREIDQPCAALLKDLKQRDMLKDTLVVWGGEFGRTCYLQGRISKSKNGGRDHHPNCFTFWMAGGGLKPGVTHGETDELGYHIVSDGVHVNDFHATMLHLLGIDHERLTFRFQGRDFRLTDVGGKVINKILT